MFDDGFGFRITIIILFVSVNVVFHTPPESRLWEKVLELLFRHDQGGRFCEKRQTVVKGNKEDANKLKFWQVWAGLQIKRNYTEQQQAIEQEEQDPLQLLSQTNKRRIDAQRSKQHNDHDWTSLLNRGPHKPCPACCSIIVAPWLHLVREWARTRYPWKQDAERRNDTQTDPLPRVPTFDQAQVWHLDPPQWSQGDPSLWLLLKILLSRRRGQMSRDGNYICYKKTSDWFTLSAG